jgi:hypothetical protein
MASWTRLDLQESRKESLFIQKGLILPIFGPHATRPKERSFFKPKKKDKRNAQIKSAQGLVMNDKLVDMNHLQ